MGLFDMFGAGGGSVLIQPTSPHAASGSAIAGNLVFMGGKRAQNVTKLTLRLTMEQRTMQMTNQGMQPQTNSREVVPATTVAQMFSTTPGQPSTFPFQLPVPPGLPSSAPGSVTFHLRASADIDGEVDPGASLEVQVVGTPPAAGAMPNAGVTIAPGTHVMAQWTDGQRHPGRVQAHENGMYRVDWDEAHLGASSYVYPQQIQVSTGPTAMPGMHAASHLQQGMHAASHPQQGMHAASHQQGVSHGKAPYAQQGHDPHAKQAHDPYAKQAHDPYAKQAHDPYGKQAHDPYAKQAHDPHAKQAVHAKQAQDAHAKGLGSLGDPPTIGSAVMAQHPNNHQWYPGRVAAMQNGMIGVDWDDPNLGQSTWVAPTAVRGR